MRSAGHAIVDGRLARFLAAACLAGVGVALFAGGALALERHPAPGDVTRGALLAPPNQTPEGADTTSFGVNLDALVFLDADDAVVPAPPGVTVDTHRVPLLDDPQFKASVAGFIGQPLSQRLIGEIEAAVARFHREKGYPFVSIITPPQEISGGDLRLRVVEFVTGTITAAGNTRAGDRDILGSIRLETGNRIYAPKLAQDLEWLSRSPFREVTAEFSPGTDLGVTNLTVRSREERPWSAFAGYSNTGPRAQRDRYFAGASVGDVWGINSLASFQVTGSPDFWIAGGKPFGAADSAAYASIAGLAVMPLGPRSALQLSGDGVRTNTSDGVFETLGETVEGALTKTAALSNVIDLPGDLSIGVEARRETKTRTFGGAFVDRNSFNVYQATIGWSSASGGDNTLAVDLHYSPGNLDAANSDTAMATASQGRVTSAAYSYMTVDASGRMPIAAGFDVAMTFLGQASTGPLPETEQVALGGLDAVRGFYAEDGTYDMRALLRSEVLLPSVPFDGGHTVSLRPYAFVDTAAVGNVGAAAGLFAASAGAGGRFAIGNAVSGEVAVARTLTTAAATPGGNWTGYFRLTGRY